MAEDAQHRRHVPDPRRTAAKLAAVYVPDMLVVGQGVLSLLTATIGFACLTVAGGWSFVRSQHRWARNRVARAALFGLLGVAAHLTGGVHARRAERQAERIIHAAVAYERETGAFPSDLDDLVPTHLPAVPRSKYTVMYADFMYSARESSHVSSYVAFPPFGRRLYHFEAQSWSVLDWTWRFLPTSTFAASARRRERSGSSTASGTLVACPRMAASESCPPPVPCCSSSSALRFA